MKLVGPTGAGERWYFDRPAPEHRHPDCERPLLFRELCSGRVELRRCNASNVKACEPCGVRYRRRVRRIVTEGALLPGRVYLLTLTAPGSERHRIGRNGPWCECTPEGGVDLAVWNGRGTTRWNHLLTDLRRTHHLTVSYFRAVELQRRGAIHYHVVIRVTAGRPLPLRTMRRLAIHHGFGHEVKLDPLRDGPALARAAGYVAKYVSKSAGERGRAPYCHPVTGEIGAGRWRTWSSSRCWGSSMKELRAAQLAWVLAQRALTARADRPDSAAAEQLLLIPGAGVTHGTDP